MAKKSDRTRRKIRRLLLIWTALGIIGLLWILYCAAFGVLELCENLYTRTAEETDVTAFEADEAEVTRVEDANVADYREMVTTEESQTSKLNRECQALYKAHKELLVLVNKDNELEEGSYEDSLRSICNGRLQASDYLYDDLVNLLAAAKEDGYQYWIASAYRSRKRQQELVDEDVKRYMGQGMSYAEALEKTYEQTMPAGYSEHETGLALDILCSENVNMDISQAEEPGNQWLAAHAHEYGFILRYPYDKEDITGIRYEPWHFRYVGKEAASFLWENELTLEEFWERLIIASS